MPTVFDTQSGQKGELLFEVSLLLVCITIIISHFQVWP